MAAYAGQAGFVLVGATPDAVGELRSWTFTETARPQATRVLSSEWDTFLSGSDVPKGWEGSMTAWWDPDDLGQIELTAGVGVEVTFQPSGGTTGDTEYKGQAIVQTIVRSAEDEGVVEVEFTVLGNGAIAEATIP